MYFTSILKSFVTVCFVFGIISAVVLTLPTMVTGQVPFGGTIATTVYCLNGIWVTLAPGIGTSGSYMYIYGASVSPFLSGPPTHPGQSILGFATAPSPCLQFCGITVCPIGFGLTIMPVHGTSL